MANTSLFNNPVLSDVKIKQTQRGNTIEYHGHKAVLCPISLLRECFYRTVQASEPVMELCDDRPDIFEFMLKFIYTLDHRPQHRRGPEDVRVWSGRGNPHTDSYIPYCRQVRHHKAPPTRNFRLL
ncbi:hypothetical protein BCR34DRAFT_579013 [Clohesyomyces aquaticus]|uniref:BTB domain-containing protein n=1 Tax=Clohesyomyces aquaticus TaxID=1231657 RepID=A0A1Y1YDS1_9PLEO|nr:hypothetical protein BCR34DRAFT_579013 [Clohesyomyces aquaticus]